MVDLLRFACVLCGAITVVLRGAITISTRLSTAAQTFICDDTTIHVSRCAAPGKRPLLCWGGAEPSQAKPSRVFWARARQDGGQKGRAEAGVCSGRCTVSAVQLEGNQGEPRQHHLHGNCLVPGTCMCACGIRVVYHDCSAFVLGRATSLMVSYSLGRAVLLLVLCTAPPMVVPRFIQ